MACTVTNPSMPGNNTLFTVENQVLIFQPWSFVAISNTTAKSSCFRIVAKSLSWPLSHAVVLVRLLNVAAGCLGIQAILRLGKLVVCQIVLSRVRNVKVAALNLQSTDFHLYLKYLLKKTHCCYQQRCRKCINMLNDGILEMWESFRPWFPEDLRILMWLLAIWTERITGRGQIWLEVRT